jgi:propionyl-CoA synthetase
MEKKYQTYNEISRDSLDNPESFYATRAKTIDWVKEPTQILDAADKPFARWFKDGVMNIAYNCVDRHAKANPDKLAFIYEGPIAKETRTMTYGQLLDQVSRLAGALKTMGLNKGDRAIIYMPMVLESAVCMLACARIGVIHSVVFGGFSSKELASRIRDCKPKIILSASCGLEPHKTIEYPVMVREACRIAENENLLTIFLDRKQHPISKLQSNERFYHDIVADACLADPEPVESSHPLYILYTSGTTGQPKGIYRDCGGTAVSLILSMELGFGFTKDSIIFATSDIGWVVGHSYMVYGPLLCGGTSIFYEGKPVGTPDVKAYFSIVEKYKVDILYSSPTAIRSIKKEDPEATKVKECDISSLKVIGMVGERTDIYTYEYLKRLTPNDCLYNDTYWQTETGHFISANFMQPERFKTKGGSCTKAYPGYDIYIKDDSGQLVETAKELGHVVIKLPMPPGFMSGLWNNNEYFLKKYMEDFPGYYYTGDAGYFDEDGYLHILTRTDDVINVAGHRLSTAQMEECLLKHPDIAEAAVVGIKDGLKGQIPFGLVVLKSGHVKDINELTKEVIAIVRDEIGPVAFFQNMVIVPKLPKTRSGKILRATIKKIIDSEEWRYPETIDDSTTLDYLTDMAGKLSIKRDLDIVFDENIDHIDSKKIKLA